MREEEEPGGHRRRPWRPIAAILLTLVVISGFYALQRLGDPRGIEARPVADVSSERLLALGSVVGLAAPFETHAWLGIPFARPPVGALRWRAPQVPDAWADTRDALAFGASCLQLSSELGGIPADGEDGIGGSEDCLTLNIWAPRSDTGEAVSGRRPVMVWIHGGANTRGSAGLKMYEGARLAGTQGLVVVSLQYRLGPFGWLSHPALRGLVEDRFEASGNFGLLDQIRGLEWIQANIEEFGGDPDNVTIFGHSAGGTDVLALLISDAAEGLFHRAIAQSASMDTVSRSDAENAVADPRAPGLRHSSGEIVAFLVESAGVVPGREAARDYAAELPHEDLADLLRSFPAREVLNAYREPGRPDALEVPNLIRDGHLLPTEDLLSVLHHRRDRRIPVMLGSIRDEMKLRLSQNRRLVSQRFGLFYRIRDRADSARRARLHSDLLTVRGVIQPASALRHGGWEDVYAYRFDWDSLPTVLGQEMSELIGAGHGFELPFLFGSFDTGHRDLSRLLYPAESEPERRVLAESMMSYWAEFARTGHPGRGGRSDLPQWPSSRPGGTNRIRWMVLDGASDGGIRVEQSSLSRDEVISAVDAEEDLGQAEKCALLADLFRERPDWDPAEWLEMGRAGCEGVETEAMGN
jgi:para-nitrobenzyl esterase